MGAHVIANLMARYD